MTSVEQVCRRLRREGRRVTPQRRAIVQVLVEDGSHQTAEQILRRARRELPDISPATVYNTLHELAELGLLRELDLGLGLGQRLYDLATGDHDHLVCLTCSRVEDISRRAGDSRLAGVECDFEIVDRRVIYLGYCPACASEQDSEDSAN